MSIESAKAFCARIMSDDDFRDSLGKVKSADEIVAITTKEYSFNQGELVRAVNDMTGETLEADKLELMVCDFYREELGPDNPGAEEYVRTWFKGL